MTEPTIEELQQRLASMPFPQPVHSRYGEDQRSVEEMTADLEATAADWQREALGSEPWTPTPTQIVEPSAPIRSDIKP